MLCFNEGGADCPPIVKTKTQNKQNNKSFNEGGADCPPIDNPPSINLTSRVLQ